MCVCVCVCVRVCGRAHFGLVNGGEHGHLHVLPPDRLGLSGHGGPRGLGVVAADADEEEEQGDGQGDGHAGDQDVQDLHVTTAALVLVVV